VGPDGVMAVTLALDDGLAFSWGAENLAGERFVPYGFPLSPIWWMAPTMFAPCETGASSCGSFATISFG